MNIPFLSGEKVALRGIEREDLAHIMGWLNDPDVTQFMIMGDRPTHLELLTEEWEREIRNPRIVTFAIIENTGPKMVGWCGLYSIHPISRAAEFRIFIGDKGQWNKGLAQEATRLLIRYAFEKLNLNKIYLGVNASYTAAVTCYEKAGFKREGVLREEIFRNNQYYDAVRMSILKSEYIGK